MSIDSTGVLFPPTTDPDECGTHVTVAVKSCCGVPREQSCRHDLPASAFEPGCGKPIMCRPASQWNDPATALGVALHRAQHPNREDGCVLCEPVGRKRAVA